MALLVGCEVPATQLVVIVDTDMAGAELDGFQTRVLDAAGRPVDERTFARGTVPPAVRLPATFGVGPLGGDAHRHVTVEVVALHGTDELFRTRAVTGFVAERALALDMFLARRCVAEASTCGAGRTCRRNGCEDEWVAPDSLQPWNDDLLARDAAVDETDGAVDASVDAPQDAAADAGGVVAEPWALLIEGPRPLTLEDGAVGADGTFYLVGDFPGSIAVGGEGLVAVGDRDGFIAAIGPDGIVSWVRGVGGALAQVTMTSAAAGLQGGLWVGGSFLGVLGPPWNVDSGPAQAGFVAQLTPDGVFEQIRTFTSSTAADLESVAVGPDGRLAVGGIFSEDIDGPTGQLAILGDAAFVGVFDPVQGSSCLLPVTASPAVVSSVVWGATVVLATGTFRGIFAADASIATARGNQDVFALAVEDDCVVRGVTSVGGDVSWARVVAVDDQAQVFARLNGELAEVGAQPANGGLDVLSARLDPIADQKEYALSGGAGRDTFYDLAVGGGSMWAVGSFQSTATFGIQSVVSEGSTDGFLVRVDDAGDVQDPLRFGGADQESIEVVAVDAAGVPYVAGAFSGNAIDLGAAGVVQAGLESSQAFAARLSVGH